MQSNNYIQSKMPLLGVFSLALLFASCGSYQYAGYEDDAIYGKSGKQVEYTEQSKSNDNNSEDSGYYKNYFKEKTHQYANVSQDDVIFTDIDSYEGNYQEENDSLNYDNEYAGWGQDHNDNVTVEIYGGHLYNSIWWNRSYYGYGYGYGYGYFNPFWCPPYYGSYYYAYRPWWYGGYHYYSPYGYGSYYGNSYYGYYGRRAIAYNAARRNPGYSNSDLASLSRQSSVNTSVRRGTNTAVRRNTNSRARPNTNYRGRPNTTYKSRPKTTVRGRPNTTRPNSNAKPRGHTKTRPTSTSRSRPTTKKRNNNSSFRRSSSSSNRSSSFSRPSSSRRSSGTRSSGRSGSSKRGGRQ